MNNIQPIPSGFTSLTPHLVCRGAAEAIDFYVKAFGAVEMGRLPGPDGRLAHAMIQIGDAMLILVDEYPEQGMLSPLSLKGSPVTLHLYVSDVDAAFSRAVEAGARVTMPVADMFWGDRYGRLEDPFGHQWSVATHQRDLTQEEITAGMMAGCADTAATAPEPAGACTDRNPVGWFEIYVQDMERAKAFYSAVFDVTFTRLESPIELWAFPIRTHGGGAAGALAKVEGSAPSGNNVIVYFNCDDCAVEADKAAAAGGKIHKRRFSIGQFGYIALVTDSEGNMIGLHSMK